MDLDTFASIAADKDWGKQSDGFTEDVDHAAFTESNAFRMSPRSTPQDSGALVFELEWLGDGGSLADMNADFFRMYGKVAEEAQFVSMQIDGQSVVYRVIVGDATHGHRATFRLVGRRAATVIARYEQLERDSRGPRPQR